MIEYGIRVLLHGRRENDDLIMFGHLAEEMVQVRPKVDSALGFYFFIMHKGLIQVQDEDITY